MAPRKTRGARSPSPTLQLRKSLEDLVGVVERLVADVDHLHDEQRIHIKRMAQLQAELDAVKRV